MDCSVTVKDGDRLFYLLKPKVCYKGAMRKTVSGGLCGPQIKTSKQWVLFFSFFGGRGGGAGSREVTNFFY